MTSEAGKRVSAEVRRAIRTSDESIRALAARHGINPKTVAKWRRRQDGEDRRPGPARPASTTLSPAQEAMIAALRRYVPLTLNDSLSVLRPMIPDLSRSALHRCLKRHGLSRQPDKDATLPTATGEAGCFHLDIVPLLTGGQVNYLFLAIEQASALIFALLLPRADQASARDFLTALADASPAPVRSVLTDDRPQFTTPGNSVSGVANVRDAIEAGSLGAVHPFEYACALRGIDHHLVHATFPWDAARADAAAAATAGIGSLPLPAEALVRARVNAEQGRHNMTPLAILGGLAPGPFLAATGNDVRTINTRDSSRRISGGPRGRDSTREAILEAARVCLASAGPEGLSLSEVARLAGVNRGTAYQHFKTRDRLITETAQFMSERLHDAVFGDGNADTDFALLAERLAGFAMDNPELSRAWLLQLLSASEPGRDIFWQRYAAATVGALRPGQGPDRDVLSVMTLAGALLWPVRARMAGGEAVSSRTAARRFAREALRIARSPR